METGRASRSGLRAHAHARVACVRIYDVLALLLSRPRYSERQDNERPRGGSLCLPFILAFRVEWLLGDVVHTPRESSYVFQDYRLITVRLGEGEPGNFFPLLTKDVVGRVDVLASTPTR